MAFGLSVEKWVGVSTGRDGERDVVKGVSSQALEGETHSKCEEESEWYVAGAWGHRGAWREISGAEGQRVGLCKALRGPDTSLEATGSLKVC